MQPATVAGFHDRTTELAELTEAFESLAAGTPAWVAIIGRKVDKTSRPLGGPARRVDAPLEGPTTPCSGGVTVTGSID